MPPLDLNAIRGKLEKLSGQMRNDLWKVQPGIESQVRIVPFLDLPDGEVFREVKFYYNIGSNPGLIAPSQFGKPDPFKELNEKLRKEGTKESLELAKKVYPKNKWFAAVIVRGEEEKGVRLWSFGKTVCQSLYNIFLDEDYGDITHVDLGRDLRVTQVIQPGRKYPMVEVRPRATTSKLAPTKEQVKKIQESIPRIEDVYPCKSYDELTAILQEWLSGGALQRDEDSYWNSDSSNNDSKEKEDDIPFGKSDADPSKEKKKFKSLDEAFEDLENS